MQYFLLESFAIFIREDLKIVDKYYILKKVNSKPGDLNCSNQKSCGFYIVKTEMRNAVFLQGLISESHSEKYL